MAGGEWGIIKQVERPPQVYYGSDPVSAFDDGGKALRVGLAR